MNHSFIHHSDQVQLYTLDARFLALATRMIAKTTVFPHTPPLLGLGLITIAESENVHFVLATNL